MGQDAAKTAPAARMREPRLDDLEPVARLIDGQSPGAGKVWRDRMRWQIERNPWSSGQPWGYLLVDGPRVVGYYFVLPWPVVIAGRSHLGSCGLDLYILPEYRGKGASLEMIRTAHELYKPAVSLATSCNPATEALWTRLGGTPVAEGKVTLLKPVRWVRLAIALLARALWGPGDPQAPDRPEDWRGPRNERDAGAGWRSRIADGYENAAAFWDGLRDRFGVSTDRTIEFLSWRYGPDSPGGVVVELRDPAGKLRAWYSYRLSRRGARLPLRMLRVLDLVADPADHEAIDACVRDLVRRTRACGAHVAELQGMALAIRSRFEAAGFRRRARPFNPFFVLPLAQSVEDARGEWHLVMGDGDAGVS